jgi:hypothetical protein
VCVCVCACAYACACACACVCVGGGGAIRKHSAGSRVADATPGRLAEVPATQAGHPAKPRPAPPLHCGAPSMKMNLRFRRPCVRPTLVFPASPFLKPQNSVFARREALGCVHAQGAALATRACTCRWHGAVRPPYPSRLAAAAGPQVSRDPQMTAGRVRGAGLGCTICIGPKRHAGRSARHSRAHCVKQQDAWPPRRHPARLGRAALPAAGTAASATRSTAGLAAVRLVAACTSACRRRRGWLRHCRARPSLGGPGGGLGAGGATCWGAPRVGAGRVT